MTTAPISTVTGIAALSDPKVFAILDDIASSKVNREFLVTHLNLSTKEYYSRISLLLKAGVIARKNGILSLTAFGIVIHDAQNLIGVAFNNYWKLGAIDALQTSHALPQVEYRKIVNTLLNDDRIKDVLIGETRPGKVIESPKLSVKESVSHRSQKSRRRAATQK